MRSFLAGLRRLVIPWGAAADQPRVVIATDDPLAVAAGQAAAQVFYWKADGAFLQSVQYVPAADRAPGGPEAYFRVSSYRLDPTDYGPLATALTAEAYPDGKAIARLGGFDTAETSVRAGGLNGGRVHIAAAAFDTHPGVVDIDSDTVNVSGSLNTQGIAARSLALNGKVLSLATVNTYVDVGPGLGTASTAYVDMPGGMVAGILKVYPSTQTRLRVSLRVAVKASAPCVVRFAANVGTTPPGGGTITPGSDFSLGKLDISQANVSVPFAIERDIANIAAGDRAVQIRWRVASAAGPDVTFGVDHSASITVTEVTA